MAHKRQFPYYSAVPEIELKRRQVSNDPGRELETNPRVYQAGAGFGDRVETQGTDFTRWTEQQIKAFLDKRGEDFDDCKSFQDLVERAGLCEFNTGPAPPPTGQNDDEEEDPLEAYMAMVDKEKEGAVAAAAASAAPARKADVGGLELDEEEDHVADYMQVRRQTAAAAATAAVAAQGYNSDDEVYETARAVDANLDAGEDSDDPALYDSKKKIEVLPPLNHAEIDYPDFEKNFYDEAPEVAALTPAQVNERRRQLGIRVSGFDAPKPIEAFKQAGFDSLLMSAIIKAGYKSPTGIQAQALPAALAGRDILGIAKTGSGKTAAFVLPMLVHIMDQPELEKGAGPIGVIVAPTRELSEQIHKETRKFSKPYNLRVCAAFGGLSKYEQFKDLKAGSEVAVCTPGRMIDLLKMKACNFLRATYLVFDEADRMFDMGFEPQVRSVIGQMRPDRQTLLFSATMPNKVERLVRDALTSPVRITVGEIGAANEDIKQVVEVVEEAGKMEWLLARLAGFVDQGDVLVFANQKARVDEVNSKLQAKGFRSKAIHGDMDQHTRMGVLTEFKAGSQHVLVATDVAARGLDIRSVKTVVNFDVAKDIDTHVHRVGRTGRAGDRDGVAYTLIGPREAKMAGELVTSLVAANQEVPAGLMELANKDSHFRKRQPGARSGGRGGGRVRGRRMVGGAGLGFGDPSSSGRGQDTAGPLPASLAGQSLTGGQAGFEAGFSRGGFESTVEGTAVPAAGGAPPAARVPGRPEGPGEPGPPPPAPKPQGVWGGRAATSMFQNRFKTAFVASGSTGGDTDARPTIVAPRQPSQRPAVPPPPVPVTARPLPVPDTGAFQAIEAAKAIAARLSSGVAGRPPAPSTTIQPSGQSPPSNFAPPASYNSQGGNYPPPPSYGSQPQSGYPPRPSYGSQPQSGYPPPPSYGSQPQSGYPPPPSYGSQPQSGYPPPPSYSPPRQSGFSGGFGPPGGTGGSTAAADAIAKAKEAAAAVAARLLAQTKGTADVAPSGFSSETGQAYQWSSGRGAQDAGRSGSQRDRNPWNQR